jgi:hypothetical protein
MLMTERDLEILAYVSARPTSLTKWQAKQVGAINTKIAQWGDRERWGNRAYTLDKWQGRMFENLWRVHGVAIGIAKPVSQAQRKVIATGVLEARRILAS